MKDISVQQVIISNLLTRGNGKDDPIRRVLQVFDFDGNIIAENDSQTFTPFDLVHFANWCIENKKPPSLITVNEFYNRVGTTPYNPYQAPLKKYFRKYLVVWKVFINIVYKLCTWQKKRKNL